MPQKPQELKPYLNNTLAVSTTLAEYYITAGDEDELNVVARLYGPVNANMAELRADFDCLWYGDIIPIDCYPKAMDWLNDWIEREDEVLTRMRAAGYNAYDLPRAFVQWLCREHGFIEMPIRNTYHVSW